MEELHSYNSYEYKFKGIRASHNMLLPVSWTLNISFAGMSTVSSDLVMTRYQAVLWWLNEYLRDIYLVSKHDASSNEAYVAGDFENVVVELPNNPTDNAFAEALHSKLEVLGGGVLHIIQVSLSSDDASTTCTVLSNAAYSLPMDNKQYEGMALYDEPWWMRRDCDAWDPMQVEGVEKQDLLDALSTSELWDGINEEFVRMMNGSDEEEFEAEIIPAEEVWKPRIV